MRKAFVLSLIIAAYISMAIAASAQNINIQRTNIPLQHDGKANKIIDASLRQVALSNTGYTYSVPEYFVDVPLITSSKHIFLSGDAPINFITGVMIEPLSKYPYFPITLSKLEHEEQEKIMLELKATIIQDTHKRMQNFHYFYTNIAGQPCFIYDFDDAPLHNRSYLFVKNNELISFDFGYPSIDSNQHDALINEIVATINL